MIINFNILLYIGFSFVIGGFILFIIAQHYERKAEKKLFKLQQLSKSFEKHKQNNSF